MFGRVLNTPVDLDPDLVLREILDGSLGVNWLIVLEHYREAIGNPGRL